MLDESMRAAILELHRRGKALRAIARAMGISRKVVRKVIRAGTTAVPRIQRPEKAEPYRAEILELHGRCNGNLVRVHEELVAQGAALSYQALTAFCRRQGIGHEAPERAGHYHFDPGQEMQHDTSPHVISLGGKLRSVQTASLVLCYSRMLFFQFFPGFRRFDCKVFLTDALAYMGGACEVCMIDNTHIVVLRGTGAQMVPVPEMEAFADRLSFTFKAHEKGDADRSARVERPFHYIENNFLAGRCFRDWDDANDQARAWCDRVNGTYKKHLRAVPRELYAVERPKLKPLPLWTPPVYLLHQRMVDLDGFVSVNTNRYSVPSDYIGRRLEVRETKKTIEVFDGPRLVVSHQRLVDPVGRRMTLIEHHPRRAPGTKPEVLADEAALVAKAPELAPYVAELKKRTPGRGTLAVRRLLRLVNDYPRQALLAAIGTAMRYGLFDLERVERMVLRGIARDYFDLKLPSGGDDDDEG